MEILALPSNTCLNGPESRASDPSSCGPRLNAHRGNILLLDFLVSMQVKPVMSILPISANL